MSLRRYTALVGWGLLVTTLGQIAGSGSIGYLPLRFLLKDQLHTSPIDMAAFCNYSGPFCAGERFAELGR